MRRVLFRISLLFFHIAALGLAQRLTLQDACALALRNNPHIKVDALAPLLADEAITAARSSLYPTINGHSSAVAALEDSRLAAAGAINNPIIFSRVAVGVSGSQILSDFGRTASLVASARLRADSQRQAVQASRSQILLAVHQAFFNALRLRKIRDLSEQRLASLKDATGLAQAEANFAATKARNDFGVAMIELAALLGTTQQGYELVEPDLELEGPPSPAMLIAEALKNRPELAALRLERDAAARFAQAEARLSRPVLSAVGNVGVAPLHASRLNPRFAAAGILLNIPIFNGHLFDARKNDAQLRLQSLEQRIRELENSISREAAVAALRVDTSYQRVLLMTRAVELAVSGQEKRDAGQRLDEARHEYRLLRAAVDFNLGRLR